MRSVFLEAHIFVRRLPITLISFRNLPIAALIIRKLNLRKKPLEEKPDSGGN
jgi:hypothetical protein